MNNDGFGHGLIAGIFLVCFVLFLFSIPAHQAIYEGWKTEAVEQGHAEFYLTTYHQAVEQARGQTDDHAA